MNSLRTAQTIKNREKITGTGHREEQQTMKICDKQKKEGKRGPETKMEEFDSL